MSPKTAMSRRQALEALGTAAGVALTIGCGRSVKVSQSAFPESVNNAVYGTGVYASRGQNPTSNASDNVFADSLSSELATLTGDAANGYTATFRIGISV